MNGLLQDVRYALRQLRKSPGFTSVAVITLALGIGANTALFSIVKGVLMNPLPFNQPDRLVAVYSHTKDFAQSSISYPNFLDWTQNNRTFSSLAGFRQESFEITGMGEPERLKGEMVSATFLPLLGVQPVVGRTFRPEEDQLGGAPVVLLGGGFWKRKFASSPDIAGKTLTLNGVSYAIIGVIPPSFRYYNNNFYADADVFVPIAQWSDPLFRDRRTPMGMDAVGLMKPGVTFEQAKSDMDSVAAALAREFPEADKDSGVTLVPLKQNVTGEVRPILLVLFAAVGFVLMIACVNVANLMLARSTGRSREFAVRASLGASQFRMVRNLLTESVLLSLAGGGLGLLFAAWGTRAALALLPEALPRVEEIQVNASVLLFALFASVLVGIIFGVFPALKTARPDLQATLKEGGRGMSDGRHRLQNFLVVAEVALALALLSGAGLMIRSLSALWSVNPGFEAKNVLRLNLVSPGFRDMTPEALRTALLRLRESLGVAPGVQAASLTFGASPMRGDSELPFWLEGQPKPSAEAEMKVSLFYTVQPEYLDVMKIPLIRGRFLTSEDNQHSRWVTVIDERFAHIVFGDQDPIGKRINFDIIGKTAEIVGIVGHVKQWGLDEDSDGVQPQCYFPISQIPDQFLPLVVQNIQAVVRTAGSPLDEMASLHQTVDRFDSQMVLSDPQTMEQTISDSLASRRFSMILLAGFAALALVLSAVGVYGVISYVAARRTHEIGIRMALGAQPRQVLGMVLGHGLSVSILGVAIGLAVALMLTRLMANLIYGVTAHDPLTFLGVAALLIAVALAACYFPARRAAKVDPMVALRYE